MADEDLHHALSNVLHMSRTGKNISKSLSLLNYQIKCRIDYHILEYKKKQKREYFIKTLDAMLRLHETIKQSETGNVDIGHGMNYNKHDLNGHFLIWFTQLKNHISLKDEEIPEDRKSTDLNIVVKIATSMYDSMHMSSYSSMDASTNSNRCSSPSPLPTLYEE